MEEKHSSFNERDRGEYQNVPVPVGSPGEKIAELARHDREQRPVKFPDTLEDAPEFSTEDLPSEAVGIHRMPYKPRHYHMPAAEPVAVQDNVAATASSAAELLYKLETIIREKPGAALAVAAVAGFTIGKMVR